MLSKLQSFNILFSSIEKYFIDPKEKINVDGCRPEGSHVAGSHHGSGEAFV